MKVTQFHTQVSVKIENALKKMTPARDPKQYVKQIALKDIVFVDFGDGQ